MESEDKGTGNQEPKKNQGIPGCGCSLFILGCIVGFGLLSKGCEDHEREEERMRRIQRYNRPYQEYNLRSEGFREEYQGLRDFYKS